MPKTKCAFTMKTYNQQGTTESNITFGIARLPGRKQKALFIGEGTEITPVAYFKDDAHAELFHNIFNVWDNTSYRIS